MSLYCDKPSISTAHNPIQQDMTKYFEVNKHFIKGKLDISLIFIAYMSTNSLLADVWLKSLNNPAFQTIIAKLGNRGGVLKDVFYM